MDELDDGQTVARAGPAGIFHVNWHTFDNQPVFLATEHERWLKACFRSIAVEHALPVLLLEVLPGHVHLLLATFPELPHTATVKILKGTSARRFFEAFPAFRDDIGPHLWQRGYHWTPITNYRQFRNTYGYVRTNQQKHGFVQEQPP